MPRREGTAFEPGRSKVNERKRASGAADAGVSLNIFDGRTAPSGLLPN